MNITIHGKNLDITAGIEDAVNKSLVRLERFKKYINSDTAARVEIRSYPEKIYRITVNIVLPYKKNLHCEVKNEDLFIGIKNIVNPLVKQLEHFKDLGKGMLSASETIERHNDDDNIAEDDYIIEEL